MSRIGILHPGEMGISVAVSAMNAGHQVYWASENRSRGTQARAEQYRLIDVYSIAGICQHCEIILSVCPPHAAEDVARSVIKNGFHGLYLDANAVAPQRSIRLAILMEDADIRYVDGGIIGGPAWTPGQTWLYLSGTHATDIAVCFSMGPLETKLLSDKIGQASALKMCYAAYSKGTTALLAAILGTAEAQGVQKALYEKWDTEVAGFSDQVESRVRRVTAKAWRFEGEMREIAATFLSSGLPGGFHEACAEVYHRMASLKTVELPSRSEVLAALTGGEEIV